MDWRQLELCLKVIILKSPALVHKRKKRAKKIFFQRVRDITNKFVKLEYCINATQITVLSTVTFILEMTHCSLVIVPWLLVHCLLAITKFHLSISSGFKKCFNSLIGIISVRKWLTKFNCFLTFHRFCNYGFQINFL